jgi:hypothetical protein
LQLIAAVAAAFTSAFLFVSLPWREILAASCSELQSLWIPATWGVGVCRHQAGSERTRHDFDKPYGNLQRLAANCSESHRFVASLREIHAFQASTSSAVKPRQTKSHLLAAIAPYSTSAVSLGIAASCSQLQRPSLQPFSSFPSFPWCEILAASCSKLQPVAAKYAGLAFRLPSFL